MKCAYTAAWPWGLNHWATALTLDEKAGAIMDTSFTSAGLEKVFINNPNVF